jgi:Rad3-related DNA helicase
MGVDVCDAIIIFDEAHNLENTAEESFSKELSFEDLLFTENFFKENIQQPKGLMRSIKKLKAIKPYYACINNMDQGWKKNVIPYNMFYAI